MGVAWLAAATAACWAAWMAWDRYTDLDPVTGHESGPYEAWQVVGCVLCLAIVAVVALQRLSRWVVVLTMSVAFSLAWVASGLTAVHSEPSDASLWPIGLGLLFVGMVLGVSVVAEVNRFAVRLAARRSTSGSR